MDHFTANTIGSGWVNHNPDNPDVNLTRWGMYRAVMKTLWPLIKDGKEKDVLLVSTKGVPMRMFVNAGWNCHIAMYPDVDFHNLPYADDRFDAVVSDQVLEHVMYPWICAKEALRVCKPGGLQVHTTPFVYRHHPDKSNPSYPTPSDNWRFSESGLRLLFPMDVIETGGHGSIFGILMQFMPRRIRSIRVGRKFTPLWFMARAKKWDWPLSTWIIGRKHERQGLDQLPPREIQALRGKP
jgi:SAM-dependent methyltransferase